MYKGYKIRLYPTKEQEELMWKHIGSCRFFVELYDKSSRESIHKWRKIFVRF